MTLGLTPRMAQLADFIAVYQAKNGYAPTYDEMMTGLGLKSKSGISRLVASLEKRGAVTRAPASARSVSIAKGESLEVAFTHIRWAMAYQRGPYRQSVRDVLESVLGMGAPIIDFTLASAIEQVAVAWERLQDGSQ